MNFSRQLIRVSLLAITLLFSSFAFAAAQETTSEDPSELEFVLANLSQRLREDITVNDLATYEWEARSFADTSLGCPIPGRTYTQVVTPGYQFLITYAGTLYDYRVSEGADQITLCDTRPAAPVTTPTPPSDTTCGDQYVVQEEDFLFEIARECNTTVAALLNANPEITDPSLIYVNQVLTIPDGDLQPAVSIRPDSGPAGTFIQVYASGFPPGAQVEIGIGPPESEYVVVATREIDEFGELVGTIQISPQIEPPQERVAVVVLNGEETVSEPFTVTEEITPTPTPPEGVLFEEAQIYLVALGDEGRSGQEFGCGDSIVPVTVNFSPTIAPLTAALGEMFDIDTRTYGQSGLYNALYQSNLSVQGIDIENSEAIIALNGTLQVGGVCDEPRVVEQIEQTALQFSTIDSVSITLNGEPLD